MTEMKWRILVVDDEESIRRNIKAYLEDEGFTVTTVASGEAGLEALLREVVHGAIVDIRLPGMDGNRFMELAHDLRPDLVFLVYTGSVDYRPSAAIGSFGVGERHVFKKPLGDMSVLGAAMLDLLKMKTGGENG